MFLIFTLPCRALISFMLQVSAGTTAEKTLWLAELSKAATDIKNKPHVQLSMGTLKNCSKYWRW